MSGDEKDRLSETPSRDANADASPADPSPETTPAGVSGAGIDIIVDEDGRVVFTDLPPELQAIVDELDPDSPRSQVCLVPEAPEKD